MSGMPERFCVGNGIGPDTMNAWGEVHPAGVSDPSSPPRAARTGLTYSYRSHKPVKLVPYASLTKSEYQANYNRTAQASEHPRWVTMRAPYSVDYKTTGRFNGTGGY